MADQTRRGGERKADDTEDAEIDETRATSAMATVRVPPVLPQYLTRLSVRVGERFVLLKMDEIRWLEAAGKYVRVYAGSQVYTLRDSLGRLGGLLDPERFLRISREAIVNLDRVRAIETWFHGDYQLRLDGGEVLRSTKSFREDLKRLLQRRPRNG
jgi:two-component system, LytTR family, response regulator